mmetsp:Transcript_7301/g.15004  ORF Transcript_7301/g.15004 Transcript_7301/m.15004 type:complete len:225 (+) Transcript_7301:636-1310(+)
MDGIQNDRRCRHEIVRIVQERQQQQQEQRPKRLATKDAGETLRESESDQKRRYGPARNGGRGPDLGGRPDRLRCFRPDAQAGDRDRLSGLPLHAAGRRPVVYGRLDRTQQQKRKKEDQLVQCVVDSFVSVPEREVVPFVSDQPPENERDALLRAWAHSAKRTEPNQRSMPTAQRLQEIRSCVVLRGAIAADRIQQEKKPGGIRKEYLRRGHYPLRCLWRRQSKG